MEIGNKLKRLRLKLGLTQEELADRCELSKGFISLLERDLTCPSIATLCDILESLGTDLPGFFSEKAEEKILFTESDTKTMTDGDDLRGSIRWLVPSAQKNSMEPILVTMEAGGRTEEQDPHEGEEFGFVLQGTVTLVLGEKQVRVHRGESFYYQPTEQHYLLNASKALCRVLWVATPPSF